MTTITEGEIAPLFSLPTDGGGNVALNDYLGKKIILYFYPKDDTSGCTSQAMQFSEAIKDFEAVGAVVLAVSKDSVKSHDKFKAKYDLKIPLLSDEELNVANAYGVWIEKSMYGRKYMGMERATFLIDPNGKIAKIWHKVKIPSHVQEVLNTATKL